SLVWQVQKMLLKNRANLVLTDSFSSKYSINKLTGYPQDRIFVTHLAPGPEYRVIKDSGLLARVKKQYQLPDKFVLYVGDINWNKNIPGLVSACQNLKIPLVMVGKQALEENFDHDHSENQDLLWLQKQAKNNKLIYRLGFLPIEDLVAVFNLATVYCQPSFDEGFGLPVVQAMACGCPVLSSNQASMPEIAGEAAELVEPSIDSLTLGLKKLLSDQSRRKELVKKGLDQVKQFSWLRTAQQTVGVYKLAVL
ncbi:MAG: glycosyltransferase family 1 protein, partial [Patescibacteria group bacterium]